MRNLDWTECLLSHFKPALLLLSLSLTTFYRKSFSFQRHGPLVVASLLTSLSLRLHCSPLPLALSATLTLLLTARRDLSVHISGLLLQCLSCRIGSYDGQDVINNLVMFASLTQAVNLSQPTLWGAILFLSPAQLMR